MSRWVGVTQDSINRALGNASGTNYLPLSGGTLTGTLTGPDGSTWSSTGISMASGKGISIPSNADVSGFANAVATANGAFYWSSRSVIRSGTNGKLSLLNNAENSGGILDFTTDGTFKFFGRDGTTAAPIQIGNTVNAVSPTSPNRTVTMVIGGTTYYLHAKTTND